MLLFGNLIKDVRDSHCVSFIVNSSLIVMFYFCMLYIISFCLLLSVLFPLCLIWFRHGFV